MSELSQLITNALDFLHEATNYARGSDKRSLKYSVIHLASSVEILLKARLCKEHWSLLFADIGRAHPKALASGTFESVDFETAISRLRNIAGVRIPQAILTHLRALRKLRHQVLHFAADLEAVHVRSLSAKSCNIVLDFCHEHLASEIGANKVEMEAITTNLREFDEFVKERLNKIGAILKKAERVLECPRCWQESMIVVDSSAKCSFCGHGAAIEDLAHQLSEGGVKECPQCGVEACGLVVANNDEAYWYCWACGEKESPTQTYGTCPRCGRLTVNDGMCDECWDELIQKD